MGISILSDFPVQTEIGIRENIQTDFSFLTLVHV